MARIPFLLFASLLLGCLPSRAQSPTEKPENTLIRVSAELTGVSQGRQQRSGFLDSWEGFDQMAYDSLYGMLLRELEVLPDASLFQHDAELTGNYMDVKVSEDGHLKVFQAEYINGGSLEEHEGKILLETSSGEFRAYPHTFWVDEVHLLPSMPTSYLIIGHNQGCSTCFQEFAVVADPQLADEYSEVHESAEYRNPLVPAGLIRFNPKALRLSMRYEGVYLDETESEDNPDFNVCLEFQERVFKEVDCGK